MVLTVGELKELIKDLPDDVLLASLGRGNQSFEPFHSVKRTMLVQGDHSWNNQVFLTINPQGSHFSDYHIKLGLKYIEKI